MKTTQPTLLTAVPGALQSAIDAALEITNRGNPVRLLLEDGVYREEAIVRGNAGAPLEIAARHSGLAVLKGSEILADWSREENGVFAHPWPRRWGWYVNPWPKNMPMRTPGFRFEWLFLDGVPFRQVLPEEELVPGSYRVEEDEGLVRLCTPDGTPPRLVEMTARPTRENALFAVVDSRDVTLRGLSFLHGRDALEGGGLKLQRSSHVLVEDCLAGHNNGSGIDLWDAADIILRRVRANANGNVGIVGHNVDRLLCEDVEASGNNVRGDHWGTRTWFTGGFKVLDVTEVTIKRMTTSDNLAIGFWLDTEIPDTVIEDLVCERNAEEGVHLEAAEGPITMRRCVIRDSGKCGIAGRDTSNVTLEACEVSGNVGGQIELKGELPRGDDDPELYKGRGRSRDANRRYPANWQIRDCRISGDLAGPRLVDIALKGENQSPEREASIFAAFTQTYRGAGNHWASVESAKAFQTGPQGTGKTGDLAAWQAVTGQDKDSRAGA